MKKLSLQELNRLSVEEFKSTEKHNVCVVLDSIRSANNVGSVFRTCDAFLVEKLYLCGYTAQPPHKEIQKTAIGATESVHWTYFQEVTDCIQLLKQKGYQIIAIEQAEGAKQLGEFEWDKDKDYALIFGNEVSGVSDEAMKLIDECIEVPQWGTKHSLNISVCTGVVLWDYLKGNV
ncbi:MAG: RNA methyltransferase [Chitinophagales bacterium]